MNPKTIFATLGIICAGVSIFKFGIAVLAAGVVFVGIAVLLPGPP